ncbi:MAG: urea ABC transporter permease subunit UrtB [Steroidobacteraceae bacterium]
MRNLLALGVVLGLFAATCPVQGATPELPPTSVIPTDAKLDSLLATLPDADYATKVEIATRLGSEGSPAARRTLAALLGGELYYKNSDRSLVSVGKDSKPPQAVDINSGKSLGVIPTSELTRIGINNLLRKVARGALAGLQLASEDAGIRLTAVQELMGTIDAEGAALLRPRLALEKNEEVRAQIVDALALHDLSDSDAAKRLAAVTELKGNLHTEVYNRLLPMVTADATGGFSEPDATVRAAANESLATIKRWRTFNGIVEMMFFGLSLGSVLMLAGIGLAITFGVMGVINMAHGEMMMIGAYSVYVVQQLMPSHIGSSVLIAIPVAFLAAGLVGVAIERGIVRFLHGRPLETLLATFGVSLILQQLVRDIFSPNNRPVEVPSWMAGSLRFNDVLSFTYSRIYIILFAALVFVLLMLVLKRTNLGLHVRAVSQNRAMARAMGIKTDWVDAMTFGLGSGIAGVAGVALSQLTNVGPNLGQSYIVDSFMVVVFGGVGSLWGTQISGLSLGVASKVLEPAAGAVLAKILVLVALIIFIQRKPRGLFPQRGRAAEG